MSDQVVQLTLSPDLARFLAHLVYFVVFHGCGIAICFMFLSIK